MQLDTNVNVSIDICKDEIKDYRLHFDKRKNEIYTEMIDLGIEKSIKKRRSFSIKKYNGTSDEYNPPDVDTYLRLNKKNILYIHNIYKFINKYIYILYCIGVPVNSDQVNSDQVNSDQVNSDHF